MKSEPAKPTALSPQDVADRLNVPKQIVLSLIAGGRLHAVRYSRKTIRVPVWSIEDHERIERLTRTTTIPAIRRE